MKQLITSSLLFLSAILTSNAALAQNAVEKGNFIADLYYGAPNIGKSFMKSLTENNSNLTTHGVSGIGPAGVRLEYMLADKFGLGVDVIYNSTSLDLTHDSLNNDGSLYRRYYGKGTMGRVRVQARFNYHFVSTENLDAYFGVGAGTNSRFWKVTSQDPDYNFEGLTVKTLIPVSMRIAVGMRYYFIPNLGINAEIGLGGPLVSAGISLKI